MVEESDILTPGVEAAPVSLTYEAAIGNEADEDACEDNELLAEEWNKQWCEFVVTVLVNKMFRTSSVYPNPTTIIKLKESLWAQTANSVSDPSKCQAYGKGSYKSDEGPELGV